MSQHPPTVRRAIIRRLKQGAHPVELAKEAQAIRDPAHAAIAMLHVAEDSRLPAGKAADLVRSAVELMPKLDRPGRMAESWGDALAQAALLQRGDETRHAVERLQREAVKVIDRMPNGDWTTHTIVAVAPHIGDDGRRELLRRALRNHGGELAACKALVAADPALRTVIQSEAPPDIAARFAEGKDALATAWEIENPQERRETLRVMAWNEEDPDTLMAIGRSADPHGPLERCLNWTMIAGRLDRLGHAPDAAFDHAVQALARLEGKDAVKAHRKLAQTMERSGQTPPPAPEASNTSDESSPVVDIPVRPLERHAFALVDGYNGSLGAPHLRAVARAAPLCMAFNLDLVIMGFPTTKVSELVDLVDAESNVGEGKGYARQLLEADRLHLISLQGGVPAAWPGTPVATTPHPAEGQAVQLEDVAGPICLLIGQGKQGLPKRMLNRVEHHHELTGKGISMETATAMGILADRLGRLPIR